jgi:hypothetical protein
VLAAAALLAAPAFAQKKAIWGPAVFPDGNAECPTSESCSAFPTYRDLGVDVWQFQIRWNVVAPTRPANPRNPNDPAYQWDSRHAGWVREALANGIQPAVMIARSPSWANGGRSNIWSPNNPQDFADFTYAVSARYPGIRRFMIWGEPSRADAFMPMAKGSVEGPQRYADLVDASYVALKQRNPANIVIGGMSIHAGTIEPVQYMNAMKRDGRMPRMDLWGHNPFDARPPNLADEPIRNFRSLNDVDTFWNGLITAYSVKKKKCKKKKKKKGKGKNGLSRKSAGDQGASAAKKKKKKKKKRCKKKLRPGPVPPPRAFFLSEWTLPTDHPAPVFGDGFWVTRSEQAKRITAAYKMVQPLSYVDALGYFTLVDQPGGTTRNRWGILTSDGERKPGFQAYAAVP